MRRSYQKEKRHESKSFFIRSSQFEKRGSGNEEEMASHFMKRMLLSHRDDKDNKKNWFSIDNGVLYEKTVAGKHNTYHLNE